MTELKRNRRLDIMTGWVLGVVLGAVSTLLIIDLLIVDILR